MGLRFALVMSVVLNVLLALALIGYPYWQIVPQEDSFIGYRLASADTKPELCMDAEQRERIRTVLFDALDIGLKEQIQHVYEIWLRDETGQPARAKTGVENAIRAYLSARKGAENWSPPPCAG